MLSERHKHFFHRAGFGIGVAELRDGGQTPIEVLIDEALHHAIEPLPEKQVLTPGSPVQGTSFLMEAEEPRFQAVESTSVQLDRLRQQWFEQMCDEKAVLREKMTLFWHGHFACQCLQESTAADYVDTLRRNALGDFRSLLHAIAKSPAMILFLNNQQNRKDHPNENFARELMELFTMGLNNYSEGDVKEAARAFTGWTCDHQGRFIFRSSNHDFGYKTFLGTRGRLSGEDIIEIILSEPATARYLASKLYRFFIGEMENPSFVEDIAGQLKQSQYNMAEVMYFIFTSKNFYEPANQANKIKAPIDLLVQLSKLFGIRFIDSWAPTFLQRALGQVLFDPPSVAGWQGGRSWINNSTLMLRLNLARYLINNERFDHAVATPYEAMSTNHAVQNVRIEKDLSAVIGLFSGTPYNELSDKMQNSLLAGNSKIRLTDRRESRSLNFTQKTLMRLTSLPEFQMC